MGHVVIPLDARAMRPATDMDTMNTKARTLLVSKVSAPWRDKAHRVINSLCRQSYLQANCLPNGKLRKVHVPYSVPEEAIALIKCLRDNDEQTAKDMFLHNYAISKL